MFKKWKKFFWGLSLLGLIACPLGCGDDDSGADKKTDSGGDTDTDTDTDTDADCSAAGGYCSGYAPIPPHCLICDSSATRHIPAPPEQGAMGCSVGGLGGVPYCCLPAGEPGSSDCETSGADCYPPDRTNPCPPGWERIRSSCDDDRVCCQPDPDC